MEIKGLKDKQLKLYFIRRIQEVQEQDNRDFKEIELEHDNLRLQRNSVTISLALFLISIFVTLWSAGLLNTPFSFLTILLPSLAVVSIIYFFYFGDEIKYYVKFIVEKYKFVVSQEKLIEDIHKYLRNIDKLWDVKWNECC